MVKRGAVLAFVCIAALWPSGGYSERTWTLGGRVVPGPLPPSSSAGTPSLDLQSDVVYGTAEGRDLKLDFAKPVICRDQIVPLIVYIHGGGWIAGDKAEAFGINFVRMAFQLGFAVASINYRLAPEFVFPAQIHDCKLAVRFLRANAAAFGIDPDRIAVAGGSAGGHLASLVGTADQTDGLEGPGLPGVSSRVAAVADYYGPTNLTDGPSLTTGAGLTMVTDLLGGDPRVLKDQARLASPVTYASAGDPPTLIVHGEKDELVIYRQAELFAERLRLVGNAAASIKVKNAGHLFVPNPLFSEITPSLEAIHFATLAHLARYLEPALAGDLNMDGMKNDRDYRKLADCFGLKGTGSGGVEAADQWSPLADLISDGAVDLNDMREFFRRPSPDIPSPALPATPARRPAEPAAALRVSGGDHRFFYGGPNDIVFALAASEDDIYAAGRFTAVGGTAAKYVARWDGSSWSALGTGMNGSVYALAVSGSDLYAGGDFTTAGGAAANSIAKWNGTSWSALGTGMNGVVSALAVSGTNLYAGGWFTTAGGEAANRIARWDGTSWSALGTGMNDGVSALAVLGTDLYAGGEFTAAGGAGANHIAKWNGASWSALGTGVNAAIKSLAVRETELCAGGWFTEAGGIAVKYVAKWDGMNWTPLAGGMNFYVKALIVGGTDLYAAGRISGAGGTSYIAKWSGVSWTAVGAGMDQSVDALAALGADLYAGGWFAAAGGATVHHIVKWDGVGWTAVGDWGQGLSSEVRTLAVGGTALYAGGRFSEAGGTAANCAAKWDGTSWSALGTGMNGVVSALAVSGANLYAGGDFTTAGGATANRIAKWNGTNWSALGTGMNGSVYALAVSGSDLYAGGDFTTAGGTAAHSIAKWNGTGWSALGAGMNGVVSALAVSGTNLYAGGWFTTAGGEAANRIARWDGTSWSALGTGMNDGVSALAVLGTDLYAGGWFTTAGGASANFIAKWNGTFWSVLGAGMDHIVEALTVSGTELFAGGEFGTAGGGNAFQLAVWNGTAWRVLGSGTDGCVHALAVNAADLYAGGMFSKAGEVVSGNLARLTIDTARPVIHLNRNALNFGRLTFLSGGLKGSRETSPQSIIVSNGGGSTLDWTAVSNDPWLAVTPGSGQDTGVLQVCLNPGDEAAGRHTGTITVSDPNAVNSPQTITVVLTVSPPGQGTGPFGGAPPFGSFDTPLEGTAGITGAIPVTGWVLDDVEAVRIEIKREPDASDDPGGIDENGLVFIGEGTFVEGARPDVEAIYSDSPLNYRAGWGYMLLTNFLPSGGNGTYKLYACAWDLDGHYAVLGTKTIVCDNAHAIKPFGTIDTPAQGGQASGKTYVNFGWVLTPQPKTVPKDGSAIDVYVDGVRVGNLSIPPNVYDQYRADVSTAFPGLNNSDGPVGGFYLDTTAYANGVHTISWTAMDDQGAADGIGSRYFTIFNAAAGTIAKWRIAVGCVRPVGRRIIQLGLGNEPVLESDR